MVETVVASVANVPSNLPTGEMPVIGYQNQSVVDTSPVTQDISPVVDEVLTADMQELENRAHEHHVLISGEAMEHFIAVCHAEVDRVAFLDKVITEAKVTYPTEDGWVVLNCERMQELTKLRADRNARPYKPDGVVVQPEVIKEKIANVSEAPVGSLAEAIVLGNLSLAYQLIDGRAMLALAEASADFDAVYRIKTGKSASVSDLLARETEQYTAENIQSIIAELTTALDGTYSDEGSAVKMAVMKAVNTLHT